MWLMTENDEERIQRSWGKFTDRPQKELITTNSNTINSMETTPIVHGGMLEV